MGRVGGKEAWGIEGWRALGDRHAGCLFKVCWLLLWSRLVLCYVGFGGGSKEGEGRQRDGRGVRFVVLVLEICLSCVCCGGSGVCLALGRAHEVADDVSWYVEVGGLLEGVEGWGGVYLEYLGAVGRLYEVYAGYFEAEGVGCDDGHVLLAVLEV